VTDGVLFLHAWPLDGSLWDPQVASLGGAVASVAPSFPGFGGTPGAGSVMTMDAAADAAMAAADEAGLERVALCALSMGGYVAFAIRRRWPDRVLGMLLANTRAAADDAAGVERRRALAARLRAEGSGFLVRDPPPLLSPDAAAELWGTVRAMIEAQPAEAIAAAALGMAERPDSSPDLPGIDVPVTVVTSTGDTLIPPEATAPMADALPDADLVTIDGAGHLSSLEAPPAFGRVLERMLERCGLR
jgi:pimeloyl-ACP methyl ester carboxylesterase